jgi:hypothetical protein
MTDAGALMDTAPPASLAKRNESVMFRVWGAPP